MRVRTASWVGLGMLIWLGGWSMASAADDSRLSPLKSEAWDYGKARHLLSRAGFGGTTEEVAKLQALGLSKAVDSLVDFHQIPEPAVKLGVDFDSVTSFVMPDKKELAKLTPRERADLQQKKNQQDRRNERDMFVEIRRWWMQRIVESPRPLEEKLVLFWHGHFATEFQTVRSAVAMYRQNELFRRHAAGNFGELLRGITRDAAMLRYLDNDKNVKTRPNENLAREILELFSMGEGNYTEQDIKEAARALTGNAFDRKSYDFDFRASVHDEGEKVIFGQRGNYDADKLVDLILQQPATARFIARKIFVYFVHEHPAEATIDQLAGILRDSDYELSPMLKAMFASREFYSAEAVATQIKCPVQLVAGTARSFGATKVNYTALVDAARSMGQELMEPPNVKGWDGGRAWINTNTVFMRHNFAVPLLSPTAPPGKKAPKVDVRGMAIQVDLVDPLRAQGVETADQIVAYLLKAGLSAPVSEEKQKQLVEFLTGDEPLPPASQWTEQRDQVNVRLRALLVLIMSLPEYQLT